eukprot:9503507-Pyramimonas_sp.AAC.1
MEISGGVARACQLAVRRRLKVGAIFDLVTGCDVNDESRQGAVERCIRQNRLLVDIMAPACRLWSLGSRLATLLRGRTPTRPILRLRSYATAAARRLLRQRAARPIAAVLRAAVASGAGATRRARGHVRPLPTWATRSSR